MRIISKHKGYFDYLVWTKYGLDTTIVFKRGCKWRIADHKNLFPTAYNNKWHRSDWWQTRYNALSIAICGTLYFGVLDKDTLKIYWGNNVLNIEHLVQERGTNIAVIQQNSKEKREFYYNNIPTRVNKVMQAPIVFFEYSFDMEAFPILPLSDNDIKKEVLHESFRHNHFINPLLTNLGVSSFYTADKLYCDIYNWLSTQKANKENIQDKRTDKEKLLSKGFDKVTSFRKM